MTDFEYLGVVAENSTNVSDDESILDDFPEIQTVYTAFPYLKYVELLTLNGSAAASPSSRLTADPKGVMAGASTGLAQYVVIDNFLFYNGTGIVKGDAVYIYNPTGANSDQPRGFYAEAEFVLGSEDFELFAINLDYENNRLGPNG